MQNEIIYIGLGRMGTAMTTRLVELGYKVHGFDINESARHNAEANNVKTYNSISETVKAMVGRKIVWLMVPAHTVDDALGTLRTELEPGDIIIDGGNTFFKDTKRRAEEANKLGIHYLDCGTSGGVNGARNGASLMVGGPLSVVKEIEYLFIALAAKDGYGHVGDSGAGHFVKMVHNGIEYGMMGAIAEGLNFIERHQADLKLKPYEVFNPYQNGSIISSNLMNWMAEAYRDEAFLTKITGEVPGGETESEMEFITSSGETPILFAALQQRKDTRKIPSRIGTFIAAMRNKFGGHAINPK